MANVFGKDGSTVNTIAPGVVQTEMLNRWPQEWLEEDAAATPVERRTGQPVDLRRLWHG